MKRLLDDARREINDYQFKALEPILRKYLDDGEIKDFLVQGMSNLP
jgi:hypothetical protein